MDIAYENMVFYVVSVVCCYLLCRPERIKPGVHNAVYETWLFGLRQGLPTLIGEVHEYVINYPDHEPFMLSMMWVSFIIWKFSLEAYKIYPVYSGFPAMRHGETILTRASTFMTIRVAFHWFNFLNLRLCTTIVSLEFTGLSATTLFTEHRWAPMLVAKTCVD